MSAKIVQYHIVCSCQLDECVILFQVLKKLGRICGLNLVNSMEYNKRDSSRARSE